MPATDPKNFDAEDAVKREAPDWMVAACNTNPSYTGWRPGDDYMRGRARPGEYTSWSHELAVDAWPDLELTPNYLNLVVNFAFEVVGGSCPYSEEPPTPPRLTFRAWLLHPRKGASRGVTVARIEEDEVDQVLAWLRECRDQHARDVWGNLLAEEAGHAND
jgi:hypothetical protein